ncbi:hypothetical protein C8J56DRAFT_339859 [Mycena floridula]|nr:hypothetical protein C8J56DRAFT_339859 [Mycena floridula]
MQKFVESQHTPVDILLEIGKYLDADIISFIQTCQRCRLIALENTLWLAILNRLRKKWLLPVHPFQDLTVLKPQELMRLYQNVTRREKNWSLPCPKITGPIRSYEPNGSQVELLFVIPGTGLFVVWVGAKEIVLWDLNIRRVRCSLLVEHIIRCQGICAVHMEKDSCKFAMAVSTAGGINSVEANLRIYSMTYSDTKSNSITALWSRALQNSLELVAVALNADLVAFTTTDSQIHVVNFSNLATSSAATPSVYDRLLSLCVPYFHEKDLFLFQDAHQQLLMYHYPADLLPYHSALPAFNNVPVGQVHPAPWIQRWVTLTASPLPQIRYVYISSITDNIVFQHRWSDQTQLHHTFQWEHSFNRSVGSSAIISTWKFQAGVEPTIILRHKEKYGPDETTENSTRRTEASSSGRSYLLTKDYSYDPRLKSLSLVRFHESEDGESLPTSSHKLELPSSLVSPPPRQIFMDDALGVVLFVTEDRGAQQGSLHAIPYGVCTWIEPYR